MISSKRITVVAVIFIVIALVFTASAMFIQFNNAMIIREQQAGYCDIYRR